MKPKEIADMLANHAETIAMGFFPNGSRIGKEWCIGNIHGDAGTSLRISVSGIKAGVWRDFADSERGGDLLDLWSKYKKISISEAMKEAISFLGVETPVANRMQEIKTKPPVRPRCMRNIFNQNATNAHEYMGVKRGIDDPTLAKFKICGDDKHVYFPFIDCAGKLTMLKKLAIERLNGKKDIKVTSTGQKKILFGWQAIDQDARYVIICEGEINAMSVCNMGYNALAVPFGGGAGNKQDWIENEYDNLERFDKIYLWFDTDEAGETAVVDIADRLGTERCLKIKSTVDANEFMLANNDPGRLLADAVELIPSSIMKLANIKDEIWRHLSNPSTCDEGIELPWEKVGKSFVFRQGEVTVMTGINSHGKTNAALQMLLHMVTVQKQTVCVATLEGNVPKQMSLMFRQGYNAKVPDRKRFDGDIHQWNENVILYNSPGRGVCSEIMKVFKYSKHRFNASFFLLDNLSALDVGIDDYEGQRNFIQEMVNFAKAENVSVMVVAHQRKPDSEENPHGRFSIRGSGSLADLADNILIWWRNKEKERKIDEGEIDDGCDAVLVCDKQRETGKCFKVGLWFDPKSKAFFSSEKLVKYGNMW